MHRKGGTRNSTPESVMKLFEAPANYDAGCDGVVNIWDPENKKRLLQISGYPTSIAALAFSHTGTQLAVAASYTFERGQIDQPPDTIYIRDMLDSEVKPKPQR